MQADPSHQKTIPTLTWQEYSCFEVFYVRLKVCARIYVCILGYVSGARRGKQKARISGRG